MFRNGIYEKLEREQNQGLEKELLSSAENPSGDQRVGTKSHNGLFSLTAFRSLGTANNKMDGCTHAR